MPPAANAATQRPSPAVDYDRAMDDAARSHDDHSELSEIELRVRALESILVEKGYVQPAAIDALADTYESKIGPRNGAQVVARAWSDPTFREWLLAMPTPPSAHSGSAVARAST